MDIGFTAQLSRELKWCVCICMIKRSRTVRTTFTTERVSVRYYAYTLALELTAYSHLRGHYRQLLSPLNLCGVNLNLPPSSRHHPCQALMVYDCSTLPRRRRRCC